MPRKAAIWTRKGRDGFWATIAGKQVNLGNERKEAEKRFHAIKAAGKPIERSRASVAVLVDLYLEAAHSEVAATTHANYVWYLQQWVNFAEKRIASELKPLDVTAWLRTRAWNGSTRRTAVELVRRWARWAKDQGYLETDPLSTCRAPRAVPRAAAHPNDIDSFVAAIPDQPLRDLVILLQDTGARPGEIRTLTASQVDWYTSSAVVVGKTGPRSISLTSRSADLLKARSALYPTGPILRTSRGTPWTNYTINSRFARLCRQIGVKVIPYHFRHDLWRRGNLAGVSDITIGRQMGHKTFRTSYAHPDLAMLKDAVERAAGHDARK